MRRLFRQVLIYGSGRLALQLLSFITLPILTRIFTPADYGVIEAIAAMMAVVAIVASLSLESAAQRSYYDYRTEQPLERRTVLSSMFWPVVAWSTILTVALVLARGQISSLLFGSDRYATVVGLAVAGLPVSIAATFFLEVMRLRHQPGRYVLVSWFGAGSSVALILYLVAIADRGLEGFYVAGLVSALPMLALAIACARGALSATVSRRELRTMLAYALPLVPVAATAWVLQLADRFFLLRFATLDDLGLYALGVRLSNVLLLAVTAFAFAWSPFILELFSRDRELERELRSRALTYMALGVGFGAVCIIAFAREFFLTFTGTAFEDAYTVVGILCVGVVALGLNAVTGTGITIARRTGYFARYALYTAVLNVALNLTLIPPFGIVGAAVATSATYVVLACLYYYRAQRVDPVAFEVRRVLTVLALATVLGVAGTIIVLDTVWLNVLAKLALVLAFPVAAWALGCVDNRALTFLRLRSSRAHGSIA